jgi:hypothetical protein
VRRALEAIGSIEAFETFPHPDDDAELHYQLVRVRVVRPV